MTKFETLVNDLAQYAGTNENGNLLRELGDKLSAKSSATDRLIELKNQLDIENSNRPVVVMTFE